MKRSEAFPSKYMSKDDVKVPIRVIMISVGKEILSSDNGEESKPVLYLDNDRKPLILNNINWMTIEDMYGDDSDSWKGKDIELYFDPTVMFGNKRVGGVRVRKPHGNTKQEQEQLSPLAMWADAIAECDLAGITPDDLKEEFKRLGKTTYKPASDAVIVRKFIADTIAAREETIS